QPRGLHSGALLVRCRSRHAVMLCPARRRHGALTLVRRASATVVRRSGSPVGASWWLAAVVRRWGRRGGSRQWCAGGGVVVARCSAAPVGPPRWFGAAVCRGSPVVRLSSSPRLSVTAVRPGPVHLARRRDGPALAAVHL